MQIGADMTHQMICAVASVCALLASGNAECAPHAVDVTRVDIFGVKLGMSTAKAVATVIDRFKVKSAEIKFETDPRGNQVTRTKLPSYFSVEKEREKLTIYLSPQIPHDPSEPMRVSRVIYELAWTPDNATAMKTSATAKFGIPSNGQMAATSEWCEAPDANPGYGCSKYPGQNPVLTLSGTRLELSDPRYQQAYIDFVNKASSTRPSF